MGADISIVCNSNFNLEFPEKIIEYFEKDFDPSFAKRWIDFVAEVYNEEKFDIKPFEVDYYEKYKNWQEYFNEKSNLMFSGNHLIIYVSKGCVIFKPLFRFSHFTHEEYMFNEISLLAMTLIVQLNLPDAIIIPDEPISFAASFLGSNDPRMQNDPNLPSLSRFYSDNIFKPGDYQYIKDYFYSIYGKGSTNRLQLVEKGWNAYVTIQNPLFSKPSKS